MYLGLKQYSMRSFAGNFDFDELEWAIAYAHERGRKIYVTMNIQAFDDDFEGMINFGFRLFGDQWSFSLTGLRPLREAGDLFVVPLIQFSYHF